MDGGYGELGCGEWVPAMVSGILMVVLRCRVRGSSDLQRRSPGFTSRQPISNEGLVVNKHTNLGRLSNEPFVPQCGKRSELVSLWEV